MSKVKLTYFDFDGGRGEPIRIALSIGGIDFEDHRIRLSVNTSVELYRGHAVEWQLRPRRTKLLK